MRFSPDRQLFSETEQYYAELDRLDKLRDIAIKEVQDFDLEAIQRHLRYTNMEMQEIVDEGFHNVEWATLTYRDEHDQSIVVEKWLKKRYENELVERVLDNLTNESWARLK